jgi:hypothetical protein
MVQVEVEVEVEKQVDLEVELEVREVVGVVQPEVQEVPVILEILTQDQ